MLIMYLFSFANANHDISSILLYMFTVYSRTLAYHIKISCSLVSIPILTHSFALNALDISRLLWREKPSIKSQHG